MRRERTSTKKPSLLSFYFVHAPFGNVLGHQTFIGRLAFLLNPLLQLKLSSHFLRVFIPSSGLRAISQQIEGDRKRLEGVMQNLTDLFSVDVKLH